MAHCRDKDTGGRETGGYLLPRPILEAAILIPRSGPTQKPIGSSAEGFPGGSDGKESACNAGDLVQSLGQGDPLDKQMATHSSFLAWRIPWTEKPCGLQSVGSQRVRHD